MKILFIIIVSIMAFIILYLIFKSPFSYPYYYHKFDISGKSQPEIEDKIDEFINNGKFQSIACHQKTIIQWKDDCQYKIKKCLLKKYRQRQFRKCIDDQHAFVFSFVRKQTRYRQRNYVRTPYKVEIVVQKFRYSYNFLEERNQKLANIGFSCTLREYHSKNQRKLMSRELREKIMIRDNYTCRCCGKYMPDEVGLHIDHIMPISKGGKTITSNLQVLCSKCNRKKSNKNFYINI